MKTWLLLGIVAALLVSCGGTAAVPPAAPIGYGTIVGYDEVTTNHHVTDIDLFDKPAGAPAPYRTLGTAHEGDRLAILEQRADGTVRLRLPNGIEGWTQSDSLKDISGLATTSPASAAAQQPRHVTYSVTGTANLANVTYTGPADQHAAFLDIQLPWSVEFDAPPSQKLFISARNPHTPTTVTCTILVDGKVWKTNSHTGDNTMAVCDDE